jgi:ABC-type lipoprotein release transport system permease subunit
MAAAARAGMPVSAVVGGRFALEPGRGPQALPVRPALLGSIVGVTGVLAALTFSAGVDDATHNMERFGVVHDLEIFLGLDGIDYVPADDVLAAVAGVEGIAGLNDTRSAVADTGNGQLAVLSVDPVGDPLAFVVTEGRLPHADGEMTIGPASARSLGVGVGDTVELTGTIGTATVTVVGMGLMPQLAHNFYTDGGLVTANSYDGLFDGFRFRAGFVELAPGVDSVAVMPELQEAAADVPGGDFVAVGPAAEPSPVVELKQIRVFPVVLAGFLALLALGAVGHALATAVRRRRHDVAVLRALGLTRTQSRWVVVSQATVLAVVGLLVGVPLGVALGRIVWRYVAETTPLLYVPPVALLALLVVVPVALIGANALAAWPGHRAASLRVTHVLRAE